MWCFVFCLSACQVPESGSRFGLFTSRGRGAGWPRRAGDALPPSPSPVFVCALIYSSGSGSRRDRIHAHPLHKHSATPPYNTSTHTYLAGHEAGHHLLRDLIEQIQRVRLRPRRLEWPTHGWMDGWMYGCTDLRTLERVRRQRQKTSQAYMDMDVDVDMNMDMDMRIWMCIKRRDWCIYRPRPPKHATTMEKSPSHK